MSLINPNEKLLARLLRGASTTDLYDVVAAALTEMKAREDAIEDGSAPVGLDFVHIAAEFGEIRWHEDEGRFQAVFYDEGSAQLAAEQNGSEVAR